MQMSLVILIKSFITFDVFSMDFYEVSASNGRWSLVSIKMFIDKLLNFVFSIARLLWGVGMLALKSG